MENSEEIESLRHKIMRFRELLNIMRLRLDEGEQAYARLFTTFSVEQDKNVKEKDLQRQLAEKMLGKPSDLRRAVMQMRFQSHELERAFEELYEIIESTEQA